MPPPTHRMRPRSWKLVAVVISFVVLLASAWSNGAAIAAALPGVPVVVNPLAAPADVGAPSWWNGDCDANHYNQVSGLSAHRLGATYLGVPVCGPLNTLVRWTRPGWGEFEFQCTELAYRFMAQVYGVAAYDGNGVDVVRNYSTTYGGNLVKVDNGTVGVAPRPGDIVSYSNGSAAGHVTVVASSTVDANGNGSVVMLSQNDSSDGWRTAAVSGWVLQGFGSYSPYGWLHDPAGRGGAAVAPGAPTYISGDGANQQMTITWSAPPSDGGAPITSYVVTASPGGRTCSWTSGPLVCTVTGLTNETAYTFVIVARNAVGPGPPSGTSWPLTPTVFSDVPMTSTFYADVMWAYVAGITTGFPGGTYHPSTPVTREAMAAFLYRMSGSPDGAKPTCAAQPFVDVDTSSPFCGEIAWLAGTKITTGFLDGTFGPKLPIERAAMAAFLFRLLGPAAAAASCDGSRFSDVPAGALFCPEITWMAQQGITKGFDDHTFRSGDSVSREAMAAFLHRARLLGPS